MPIPHPLKRNKTYAETAQPAGGKASHITCGGQDLKHTLLKDVRNGALESVVCFVMCKIWQWGWAAEASSCFAAASVSLARKWGMEG